MAAPSLLKVEPSLVVEDKPALKDIEIDTQKESFDFGRVLQNMAADSQDKGEAGNGLALKEIFDFNTLATADDIKTTSQVENYLQEAMVQIQKERFEDALEILEKLLEEAPNHQEGIYLKALCLHHLIEPMKALETLAPLREPYIELRILNRFNTLKEKIREVLQVHLLLESIVGSNINVLHQIESLTEIDPGWDFPYLMGTSLLMTKNETRKAHALLKKGLSWITGKQAERLIALKSPVEKRLLEELMQPAVFQFKKGKYRKARSILAGIDGSFSKNDNVLLFDDYLKRLGGGFLGFGKKSPSTQHIVGAPETVATLQAIITAPEIREAGDLIKSGKIEEAEWILKGALVHVPNYPYLNFLLAGCMYKRVTFMFLSGRHRGIDNAIEEMETAKLHGIMGQSGSSAKEAGDLVDQINEALNFLSRVKEELKRREAEVAAVNGAIQKFVQIMQSANDGISSLEQFEDVFNSMKLQKQNLDGVRKTVRDPAGLNALDQLEEAIDKNLEILKTMEKSIDEQKKEAVLVGEAQKKYRELMESANDGIHSEAQIDSMKSKLAALKREIETTYKGKVSSKPARDALSDLANTCEQGIGQLENLRKTIKQNAADRIHLDKLIKEFNDMMTTLNSGRAINSMSDLDYYMQQCISLTMDIHKVKNQIKTDGAKAALKQLEESVVNVFNQLAKAKK